MTANHEVLEQRYRRLLRIYPGRYRAERGEEIVGTYMECAAEERTRPSIADVGDIAKAGLRQRLRYAPEGLPGGMRLAAVMGLSIVTAVALVFTVRVEMTPLLQGSLFDSFGPYQSPAVIAWATWMLTGLAAAVLPGRLTRGLVLLPLIVTVGYIPIAYQTNYGSPPMFSVVPLVIFGAMALAWPKTPHWTMRIAPPAALVLALAPMAFVAPNRPYRESAAVLFMPVAVLLLLGALAAGGVVEYLVRRTTRALWATSLLLLPAAWFATYPAAGTRMMTEGWTIPSGRYIPTAIWLGLVAMAVPLVALAWSHRRAAKR